MAHAPDEVRDAGDGQEVAGEPEVLDRFHLVRQTDVCGLHCAGLSVGVAIVDTVPGSPPQLGNRIPGDADDTRLRHSRPAQTDIGDRVLGAARS